MLVCWQRPLLLSPSWKGWNGRGGSFRCSFLWSREGSSSPKGRARQGSRQEQVCASSCFWCVESGLWRRRLIREARARPWRTTPSTLAEEDPEASNSLFVFLCFVLSRCVTHKQNNTQIKQSQTIHYFFPFFFLVCLPFFAGAFSFFSGLLLSSAKRSDLGSSTVSGAASALEGWSKLGSIWWGW